MLPKSKISKIQMLSDEWFEGRLGKFTSSEIHFLMGDKFLTTGCQSYIHRKAGEILTGKSIKGEIDTDATRWGAAEEANAVKKFSKWAGLDFIICQQLISENGSPFGSTPDGVIVKSESSDGTKYDVMTVEVKCPPTYTNYVGLALCETPQDLKFENKIYYYQVLDQMLSCDCLVGYFVAYHPDFKQGNMRIIEFRKMQETGIEYKKEVKFPLVRDMKLLEERKKMAVEERDRIIQKLIDIGTI